MLLIFREGVTHRILEITQDAEGRIQYVTQGDANNVRDDQAVRPEQIQGIYKGERFSGLGQAILFMQSTQGMVLFILCPLFLFLIWDLWRRRQLDQAEAKRTAELEAELAALKAEKKLQPRTALVYMCQACQDEIQAVQTRNFPGRYKLLLRN